MMYDNYNKPASELTKLEYALIHSTWEPAKHDIELQLNMETRANPYNDAHKPKRRSYSEVVRDLKIEHFKQLLS